MEDVLYAAQERIMGKAEDWKSQKGGRPRNDNFADDTTEEFENVGLPKSGVISPGP